MPVARIEIEQTADRWSGSVEAGGRGLAARRTIHFDAASAEAAITRALQAYREILGVAAPVADAGAGRALRLARAGGRASFQE